MAPDRSLFSEKNPSQVSSGLATALARAWAAVQVQAQGAEGLGGGERRDVALEANGKPSRAIGCIIMRSEICMQNSGNH